MAITEPNASRMMMIAATIPIPSLDPGDVLDTLEIGLPPSATRNPGAAKRWAVAITRLIEAAGSVSDCSSNWTVA